MKIKNIALTLTMTTVLTVLSSCTGGSSDSASSAATPVVTPVVQNDAAYFEAAKQYLTYKETFGAQTDLTSDQYLKKIEFSSAPSQINQHLANIVTARKTFVVNPENTLRTCSRT